MARRYSTNTLIARVFDEVESAPPVETRAGPFLQEIVNLKQRIQIIRKVVAPYLNELLRTYGRDPDGAFFVSPTGPRLTYGDINIALSIMEEGSEIPVLGEEPFTPQNVPGVVYYSDGSEVTGEPRKIVLSGKKKLDTGIIYDPMQKPIRKFRLEEM